MATLEQGLTKFLLTGEAHKRIAASNGAILTGDRYEDFGQGFFRIELTDAESSWQRVSLSVVIDNGTIRPLSGEVIITQNNGGELERVAYKPDDWATFLGSYLNGDIASSE